MNEMLSYIMFFNSYAAGRRTKNPDAEATATGRVAGAGAS